MALVRRSRREEMMSTMEAVRLPGREEGLSSIREMMKEAAWAEEAVQRKRMREARKR